MSRRRAPTATQTLDNLKKINATIFQSMSPGTMTGVMAAVAFLAMFTIFAPKPMPQRYYTGCELSGAIKGCDAIMREYMASSSFSSIGMYGLPLDRGAPSHEDQIAAWLTQSHAENMHKDVISFDQRQAEYDARKREWEKQRGIGAPRER
jgi:hypothetical protein